MGLLHHIGHYIRVMFTHALYLLSCLFPRDKNTWVFIGWHIGPRMEIFADNTKYLFLHIKNGDYAIHPVWLAKDRKLAALLRSRGYASYYQYSLSGIWYALRAGTTVIDAFLQPENYRWSGGTRLVQLLHGKGMKQGGYGHKPPRKQDIIFSPSPYVTGMLPDLFIEKSPIVIAGYPRGDVFFHDIPGSEIGIHEPTKILLTDPKYKKKFLYAPTFRRGAKEFDIEKGLDLPRLSEWLARESHLLLISLHPKYRDQARALSYPNVHFVEDSDVYPILHLVDVLINDYSSIFTDFLLLDKPIIFYPYDLAEYKKSPGLTYDDYDSYTPGPKAYTTEELFTALKDTLAEDRYGGDRARVRALYHTYADGDSSLRVMRILSPDSFR